MKKRILSFLLALLMVVSMLPATVFATESTEPAAAPTEAVTETSVPEIADNCPYCEDTTAEDGTVIHSEYCNAAYVYDGNSDVGKYAQLGDFSAEYGIIVSVDPKTDDGALYYYNEFGEDTVMRVTDWYWDAGTTALWYAVELCMGAFPQSTEDTTWPENPWILQRYINQIDSPDTLSLFESVSLYGTENDVNNEIEPYADLTENQTINLYIGETAQVSFLGSYTQGNMSGTASNGAFNYEVTQAATSLNLGTDATFAAGNADLSAALYTFTGDNTNGWIVQNGDVNLNIYGNSASGYPGYSTEGPVILTAAKHPNAAYGTNTFDITSTDYTQFLYFHRNGDNKYRFDRMEDAAGEGAREETAFLIYAPIAGTDQTSSTEIPGNYQITSVDQIKSGNQYLIVAKCEDDYFVLYPTTSTSNCYDHVAKVVPASVTFTGQQEGTEKITVGNTTFTVIVREEKHITKNILLKPGDTSPLDPLEDLNLDIEDCTVTYTVANTCVNVIEDILTAVAAGDCTVTASINKDGIVYGTVTYNVTVFNYTDVKTILVPIGGTHEVVFANANGTEKINESMLDPNIAAVTWNVTTEGYMNQDGSFIANGKAVGTTSVIVGSTKFNIYVYEGDTTATGRRSVYVNIDAITNCSVYYAVNGADLQQVEGTGVLFNQQVQGPFHLIFFARPNDGYLLTKMGATNSLGQFYSLSDGGDDVTASSAWPYNSDGSAKSGHGIAGCVNTGILTREELKELLERALALGCDGATNFTRGPSDEGSISTSMEFVAEQLPTFEKSIIGYKRGNPSKLPADVAEADAQRKKITVNNVEYYEFGENVTTEFGDTLLYEFTITSHSINANYTNVVLNDDKIGYTKTIPDNYLDTAGSYVYYATYTLKQTDLHMYSGGQFKNNAELVYNYSSDYSSGIYNGAVSDTADCDIMGIVSYVWVSDTPSGIVNDTTKYPLPSSETITVGTTFELQRYTGNKEYKQTNADGTIDIWTYSGEWGAYPYGADTITWFNVETAFKEAPYGKYTLQNARTLTFYGRWLKNYSVVYRWGVDRPELTTPMTTSHTIDPDKTVYTYTVDTMYYKDYTIVQNGYTWKFLGWCPEGTDVVHTGNQEAAGNVVYVGKWSKTANNASLTIHKDVSSNMDSNQSYLFNIKEQVAAGQTSSLDLDVVVHGNGSVTVEGLVVGTTYVVTEITDWSWRYSPTDYSQEIQLAETGNALTFTNSRDKHQWLNGGAWCDNLFVLSTQTS